MSDNHSKTSIVRLGTTQISRYSNSLVKRAVEEIALKSPQIISQTVIKKEILVIGYPGEIGWFLAETLPLEGFNAYLNESMEYEPPFNKIFAQLFEKEYDMVIVTYWAYHRVLPELRQRFPKVKVMFLNSYSSELDAFARQHGVHDILRVPFEYDELLSRIRKVLLP